MIFPCLIAYQIEGQIESAFQREVNLPSGGAIVIDHTEALISIDINSARATKGSDIEETATNTNLEAADEIARQLRLRDLGGLVVIDFIDMMANKNQRAIENRLREALKMDRARVQIGRISRFGLLEMSRQRLRPSLGEATQNVCPQCNGYGTIRNIESLSLSLLRIAEEEALKEHTGRVIIQVPVEVSTYIFNEKRKVLIEIESRTGVEISFIANKSMILPHYDVTRVRKSEAGAYEDKTSYKLAGDSEQVYVPSRDAANEVEAEKPAVRSITPAQPAPVVEKKEEKKPGLFASITKALFGEKEEEQEKKKTQQKRKRSDRGGDRNRNRGRRGGRRNDNRGDNRNRGQKQDGTQQGRGGNKQQADNRDSQDKRNADKRSDSRNENRQGGRQDNRKQQDNRNQGGRSQDRNKPKRDQQAAANKSEDKQQTEQLDAQASTPASEQKERQGGRRGNRRGRSRRGGNRNENRSDNRQQNAAPDSQSSGSPASSAQGSNAPAQGTQANVPAKPAETARPEKAQQVKQNDQQSVKQSSQQSQPAVEKAAPKVAQSKPAEPKAIEARPEQAKSPVQAADNAESSHKTQARSEEPKQKQQPKPPQPKPSQPKQEQSRRPVAKTEAPAPKPWEFNGGSKSAASKPATETPKPAAPKPAAPKPAAPKPAAKPQQAKTAATADSGGNSEAKKPAAPERKPWEF